MYVGVGIQYRSKKLGGTIGSGLYQNRVFKGNQKESSTAKFSTLVSGVAGVVFSSMAGMFSSMAGMFEAWLACFQAWLACLKHGWHVFKHGWHV